MDLDSSTLYHVNNGTIAYRTGEPTETTQFVWLDRAGKELAKVAGPGDYSNPEISPDGRRVALERTTEGKGDLWLLELARGIFTRFTSAPGYEMDPSGRPTAPGSSTLKTARSWLLR